MSNCILERRFQVAYLRMVFSFRADKANQISMRWYAWLERRFRENAQK